MSKSKSDKIWVVLWKGRFGKKRFYKSESEMLRQLIPGREQIIIEYDLVSETNADDYLKSKERDVQIRGALGELSDFEENAINFIRKYEELVKDKRAPIHVSSLKKMQTNKKSFSNILVSYQKSLFNLSNDIEWLTCLLKCHNFRNVYTDRKWDSTTKKYISVEAPKELLDNFKLAKDSLKKKKK